MSLPADDYPELPDSDYSDAISLEQQKLSELIEQISYKMLSKDDIPAAAASAIEEGNAVLARVTAE